jgi:hypothetical protein
MGGGGNTGRTEAGLALQESSVALNLSVPPRPLAPTLVLTSAVRSLSGERPRA